MGSLANDSPVLPSAAASSSLSQSHSQDQGQRVIVLTEENFFETLHDLFLYAEHPQRRSWEAHLYRPWGYVFASWCLTFSRRRSSLTCGAQWPFLHRVGGPDDKVLGYVYPDFVILFSKDGLGAIFLIIEIKPLSWVGWNTEKGKERAGTLLARAMAQTRIQARIAFLQHKDQSSIQAFLACGVWWLAIRYFRDEVLSGDPSSKQRGKRQPRRSERNRRKKKTKSDESGSHQYWLDRKSDNEDEDDDEPSEPNHPDERKNEDHVLRLQFPNIAHRAIYHVMQLGSPKKALNPWFKAFLASVIATFPDISADDLQDSWFDQTQEERNLGYVWTTAGRPHDEGFAAGFKLPEGNDSPANTDDLSYGVDFLVQVDSQDGSHHPIAISKDPDTGVPALTSPDLQLPDQFDFLSEEALDELAAALMDRMRIKQAKGLEPSDFMTPRSSATHKSSTSVPTRPSHTVHAADRKILPLPSSSAFSSDIPLPSSPSPHDRQRDRDGFAIPSHLASHRVGSFQGRTLNPAPHVPKSAATSAATQRSQPRQPTARRVQRPNPALEAFRLIDQANRTPQPRKPRASPPSSTDESSREPPADRGRGPTVAAPSPLHEPRDQFAAASDIPSHPRSPQARPRAHSVVGVTRTHDSASDATPTPRGGGSGTRTGNPPRQSDNKLDFDSGALTSNSDSAGPSDLQTPHPPRDPPPEWMPFPKATSGPFRRNAVSSVGLIWMRTKFGPKKDEKRKSQQRAEQEQQQQGQQEPDADEHGDGPPGDGGEGGSKGGEPGTQGKGKGRADRKGT